MLKANYFRAVFSLLLFIRPMFSQQLPSPAPSSACATTLFSSVRSDRNLFNEQQEEWLGEIMDQGMRKDFHVIEDPDGNLQRLGEHLLAQLPPTTIHYHFVIIDSPGLNSFGLAGGRIYIYRRMIAFAKSEDELAALVGHEIGHMVMHQVAIHVSDLFRELGITSVGDRQDVFSKWNQFRDNAAKIKKGPSESVEQKEQLIADRIGLYAMMRAGYDPARYVEFADRSLETKGKTGNFWTDFFGATSPESKRLREIVHNTAPLPAGCAAPRPDTSAFAKWQQSVIEAKAEVAKEELLGLVKKISLRPPLRNELNYLQFSPDGRYLVAQDDSSIFLLTREPLANLFRIDAPDAHRAQFTPDSSSIVFYDKELRVQKWDITGQRRTLVREIALNCEASQLSPTGEVMACVKPDFELQIIEVKSGQAIFSKKKFFELTLSELYWAELLQILGVPAEFGAFGTQLHFSPDGRYLVAAHGSYALGYDVSAHSEVKLSGKVRDLVRSNFLFTSADEVLGVNQELPRKIIRLRFPSGQMIDEFAFAGHGEFTPAVKANYVLVRPLGIAAIGAIDLTTHKAPFAYRTPGFAIYDNVYAGDDVEGSITIHKISDKSEIAHASLPSSPLATAKASAFSPDGKWLAISGRTRGAVWKMETGDRIGYSRDFDGAFFDKEKLIVRFPKRFQEAGQVASITPSPLSMTKLYELEPADKPGSSLDTAGPGHTRIWQRDDLLLRLGPTDAKKLDSVTLDVRDVRTNASLWQLQLDRRRPSFYYLRSGQTFTFVVGDYEKIKEAAKHDAALSAKIDQIGSKRGKQSAYLLQVFEARSQKPLGSLLVDTGNLSFSVKNAVSAGDSVFISDSLHRTLVYGLQSGSQRGKVFGETLAVTGNGDKMLVENAPGVVDLYDSSSLRSLEHFTFPSRVSRAEFLEPDNLLVLTADQTVYQFSLPAGQTKAAAQ